MKAMRFWIVSAILLLLFVPGCTGRPASRTQQLVKVARAQHGELPEVVSFGGHLRALRRASVSPNESGVVADIYVNEGDRVSAGQPLLKLDIQDLRDRIQAQISIVAAARSRVDELESQVTLSRVDLDSSVRQSQLTVRQERINLEEARVRLTSMNSDLKRKRELYAGKAIPYTQIEAAQLTCRLGEDQVLVAEQRVAAAEQTLITARASAPKIAVQSAQVRSARSALDLAEDQLEALQAALARSVVRSPIAGSVVTVSAAPGQSVSAAGAPLFLIVDNASVEFLASVDQHTFKLIRDGASLSLTPLGAPDETFEARMSNVIPSWDDKTRTVRVRFRVTGGGGGLMDGLAVRAHLQARAHTGVLIPRDALATDPSGKYVVVVRDHTAHRQRVVVGYEDERNALITRGITAGEWVAADGAPDLTDGQRVQPVL